MNTGNSTVEANLDRVAARWRALRLLQHLAALGTLVTLGFLLLAVSVPAGWITRLTTAWVVVGSLALAALLGAFVLLIAVVVWPLRRGWRAEVIERSQPHLLDRVHTLVALEDQRREAEVKPFYERIARQAQRVLRLEPTTPRLPVRPALLQIAGLLGMLALTLYLYGRIAPWQRLARLEAATPPPATAVPEPAFELPPPAQVVEERRPWGEVRITDPGRDLTVTKVDVVPLEIEAAANEPIQSVQWFTARNGADETAHDLPEGADPRYVVHQPVLYLDELQLADWDVLTYHARATTRGSNTFASEVYFLEVRPFREDIRKLPGGEGGLAMQCLDRLTSLIHQQQQVVRQTHRHAQNPPPSPQQLTQDRARLADAETDLSQATRHLYAQMARDLAEAPIGESLDHLARAAPTLAEAGQSLRQNAVEPAQGQERAALTDLIAARKVFQKAVSDRPDAFPENDPDTPAAGLEGQLKDIAEFRDEQKAARELVQRLAEQQRTVASRAPSTGPSQYPALAAQQREIEKTLNEFRAQHPRVFQPVQAEADAASQSYSRAAESLERRVSRAREQTREAVAKTEALGQALERQATRQQLAEAHQLRDALEAEQKTFAECQNPGPGGGPSAARMDQAVRDTRQTVEQLGSLAKEPGAREAFGPALAEAFSDLNQMPLKFALNDFEQAKPDAARRQAAGHVTESLEEIIQAFDSSLPKALQQAQRDGAGAEATPQARFEQGLRQLGSLVRQLGAQRSMAPADQDRLAREALESIEAGLSEKGAGNESSQALLARLAKALEPGEKPLDVELLGRLLDALQATAVEVLRRPQDQVEEPAMTAVDPSRLPPAYRGRIEKYFEKLSER